MQQVSRNNIEIKLQDLKPWPTNARTHSPEQIEQIAQSIKQFGFTRPILVDEEKTILAGHGAAQGAGKAGLTSVPAVQITGLTLAQKKALVLADNKIALNAGWDSALLGAELKGLGEMGFDLSMTGFSKIEIGHLMGLGAPRAGEEDTPAVPAKPISVLGDLWLLGNHRVKCGDATSATDVADLLGGAAPALMVTDPPYGVEYDADKARDGSFAKGKVLNDDRADWLDAWVLFPGSIAYVWHADKHCGTVFSSLFHAGFIVRAQIIWNKDSAVFSRGDYHYKHEPCFYAVKGTGSWAGDRKQNTVWDIPKPPKSETGHSTQKPVECMRRPMVNNSAPGAFVYDPFLGSGTTVIAAESCKRLCLGMELNPAYVDVIVKRWQDFTGAEAVHAVTGEKFNEMRRA